MYSCRSDLFVTECTYCSFRSDDKILLIRHLFQAHCHQDNFEYECEISLCTHHFTTGATYASFLTHCNRKHGNWRSLISKTCGSGDHHSLQSVTEDGSDVPNQLQQEQSADTDLDTSDFNASGMHDIEDTFTTEKEAALFLLTLKEKYRLTQASLDFAVGCVNNIVNKTVKFIEESVMSSLGDQRDILLSNSCFSQIDLFQNLKTEYQQTKFYREHFGLVVSLYYCSLCSSYVCMHKLCNQNTYSTRLAMCDCFVTLCL